MFQNAKKKIKRDILISTVFALTIFALFIYFNFTEKWFYFTRRYEQEQLDESFGLLLGVFIGLSFLTYRLFIYLKKDHLHRFKLAKSLEYEASHDYLTTLPNRRKFAKHIAALIAEPKDANTCFTLFYIDLDSFKYINDTLGQSLGDKLLIAVTKRLSVLAINRSILARIGGDEFCLVIPGYADDNDCLALCSQLDNGITQPFFIDDYKLYISHTVGISRYPEDGACYEDLLKTAHIAMYMGKKLGERRNNFKDEDFIKAMKMRFIIEHELKDALQDEQLYVEYQPKINLQSNQLVGAEALVRWRHPQYGIIAPDQFIHIAEEAKSVHLIDFFVLEIVCKQIKKWGKFAKPIAVNLSPILFADENLVYKIMQLLNKYGVSPELIEFEITERTIVADSEIPLMSCQKLVEQGIKISLDDFGTGYSSLAHLADFPISILKIDRSFVNQICHSERSLNIVASIISLAKGLNIKVIAEGIETDEQRVLLHSMGSDEAQGYWFAKPLSAEHFFQRLRQSRAVMEKAKELIL